jgi:hypothetical protein
MPHLAATVVPAGGFGRLIDPRNGEGNRFVQEGRWTLD